MNIYLDHASSTKIDDEVLKTYQELLNKYYYNADALYDKGVALFDKQEKARKQISQLLNIQKEDIIFTSGASEANNLALKGLAFKKKKGHIITSLYEHSSVYNAIKQLEEEFNFEVTYLNPTDGIIEVDDVIKNIRDDTFLISIMAVNNEIGAINDIDNIAKACKKYKGIIFHSDITQAITKIDLDLSNIDMASFSSHKIHGLKGSGILIKKKHIDILPLISGGQQEYGMRGGTSNVLVNIMLAKTLRLALENHHKYLALIDQYYDYLISHLIKMHKVIMSLPKKHLKQLINIQTSIPSEVLLNALDEKGIMLSSKSTCGSKKKEIDRSYHTIGLKDDYAIRISFDYTNTMEELEYFIISLKEILDKYG